MKKPPYRAYRKKEKNKLPVQIPEKIDTPQAEQLVEDFYAFLHFLERHKTKVISGFFLAALVGFAYAGYRFYFNSLEIKAAKLTDKAIYYLKKGNEEKALVYLKEAAGRYGRAPSGKLAEFLLGKLKNDERFLNPFVHSKDPLLSSPSKTSLGTLLMNAAKLEEAKKLLKGVRREEWTHPEAVYEQLLVSLIKGKRKEAENYFNVLKGDYANLPITNLAEELLK